MSVNDPWSGKPLLCIGGPLDGSVIAVHHGRVMRAPVGRFPHASFAEYQLQEIFFANREDAAVWVASGVPEDEAIKRFEAWLAGERKDKKVRL